MSYEEYQIALKAGKKDYHRHLAEGKYPYLQALDETLSQTDIITEKPLGLVAIPSELIAGTRTIGRRNSFAPNFMPLLDPHSEFADKWVRLCESHVNEGIRDPVTAYEFMGRFYIVEGNKRVSVLKHFGAPTVQGIVTRLVPRWNDDEEMRIYYEYMEFYDYTGVNYLLMSKAGNYKALAAAVTGDGTKSWNDEMKTDFAAFSSRFEVAYKAKGGERLPIHVGDALLTYIRIYGYPAIKDETVSRIEENLSKIWQELTLLEDDSAMEVVMEPEAVVPKKTILDIIIPNTQQPKQLKIAFIHSKTAETSSWTYAHELGRQHVEQVFGDNIKVMMSDGVIPGDAAADAINHAIESGCKLIFTTTPEFLPSSLKMAVEHSDVRIFNCSVNTAYRSVRTYYGRMYEAKFLCGLIAGALADNNRIGYVADYPIYGMTANINAFAIGARMVNPRVKIYLQWSSVKDADPSSYFNEKHISYLSTQDMIVPRYATRRYGLYQIEPPPEGDAPYNAASPLWNWGQFYERIIRSLMTTPNNSPIVTENKALNYWWGLSSGTVDFVYNKDLDPGIIKLVEYFKRSIASGAFHPFEGYLESQDGVVQKEEWEIPSPEQIITMDYLASNVIGDIPEFEQLTDNAKRVVRLQGIKKPEITTY
jgi:basic membrane lipoprotein Med (substrate-binding protein (PBP1-ABC) superfamily)